MHRLGASRATAARLRNLSSNASSPAPSPPMQQASLARVFVAGMAAGGGGAAYRMHTNDGTFYIHISIYVDLEVSNSSVSI